jgi:hypothetical protein
MLLPGRKIASPYIIDENGHTREMVRHRYVGAGVHRWSQVPRRLSGPSRWGLVIMITLALMPLMVILGEPGVVGTGEPPQRQLPPTDIGHATLLPAPSSPQMSQPGSIHAIPPAASAMPSASPTRAPARTHASASPTASTSEPTPTPTNSATATSCPAPDGLIPLPSISARDKDMKGLLP